MKCSDSLFGGGSYIAVLGTFDGVHHGHRAVIEKAVGYGIPVAVVTTKQIPRRIAGDGCGRILPFSICDGIFSQLGVSAVIRLDFGDICDLSPEKYLDMLCKKQGAVGFVSGFNFRFGKNAAGDVDTIRQYAESRGLISGCCDSVEIDGETVSSSRIRAAVSSGDMPLARRLLGHGYAVDFKVEHGEQRGRTLGFPTINQRYPEGFVLPRLGVYATSVNIGGRLYPAVTDVGVRPTFGGEKVLAETHIIGYDGDLYSASPVVEFTEFIRDEIRFESVERLSAQIAEDRRKSLEISKGHL